MTQLSIVEPIIGQPDSTEDQKIVNAFTAIQNAFNGNIDISPNLSQAAATSLGVNSATQNAKGQFVRVANDQLVGAASLVALGTPDQVTVTLTADGLMYVGYMATWNVTAGQTATAAIFVNGIELLLAASAGPAAASRATMVTTGTGGQDTPLGSFAGGLISLDSTGATYSGDATTGQLLGVATSKGYTTGMCGPIFAAAGTYTIQIRFMAPTATLNVHHRRLWVKAEAYS